jgi:hypothetical protein
LQLATFSKPRGDHPFLARKDNKVFGANEIADELHVVDGFARRYTDSGKARADLTRLGRGFCHGFGRGCRSSTAQNE